MDEPTEHESQVAFFERVKLDYRTRDLLIFAVPNGGPRHIVAALKLKREGVKKGVPDIFVDEPRQGFHGMRIEMKRKGGKQTPEQLEIMKSYTQKGYGYALCFGAEHAWDSLMDYLGQQSHDVVPEQDRRTWRKYNGDGG